MSSSIKSIMRLIDAANKDLSIEEEFLNDLTNSIEKAAELNRRLPSKTYKPSSMNCERQMVYQVMGVEPDKIKPSYQLEGICESGTDRHIRIQKAIENMHTVLGIDCEYLDIETYIKQKNLDYLEIKEKKEMETKLYYPKYNMSFMTDGIIKYKGRYFVFEFKTETSRKFYDRKGIDPKHENQAIAYSLAFGLNNVIFVYENRDNLDKKSYLKHVEEYERELLVKKLEDCQKYVLDKKIPPKSLIISKNICAYCEYKNTCEKDGYKLNEC